MPSDLFGVCLCTGFNIFADQTWLLLAVVMTGFVLYVSVVLAVCVAIPSKTAQYAPLRESTNAPEAKPASRMSQTW